MKKSRIWVKDKYDIWDFSPGDIVMIVRRKHNGHPRKLRDGVKYKITQIEDECLLLEEESNKPAGKVHYTYVSKLKDVRDEKLKDLLSGF